MTEKKRDKGAKGQADGPKRPRRPSSKRSTRSRTSSAPPEPAPPVNGSSPASSPTPEDPLDYAKGNSRPAQGRLASTIPIGRVEWLIDDLIPCQTLTFVVGDPDCGKSCLGAWLCSRVKRPAVLPGHEDVPELRLLPRLVAAGVNLGTCLVLDNRPWSLPADRVALVLALQHHKCDLLWIDPVDSYIAMESENDPLAVRSGLESLARVAQDVPCAVIAARHPGKTAGNVCPGSRHWRAVPRLILHLTVDDGPPLRRYLRWWKPFVGGTRPPREYTLLTDGDEPPVFKLGPAVNTSDVEMAALSDPIERRSIELAEAMLKQLLKDGEVESGIIRAHAERERLNERTVRRAGRRLRVVIRRRGSGPSHQSFWWLPSTPDSGQADTDTPL